MKVSVIIPTFNLENLIKKAIESVLIQVFPKEEREIMVVNDETINVLGQFSKEMCVHIT